MVGPDNQADGPQVRSLRQVLSIWLKWIFIIFTGQSSALAEGPRNIDRIDKYWFVCATWVFSWTIRWLDGKSHGNVDRTYVLGILEWSDVGCGLCLLRMWRWLFMIRYQVNHEKKGDKFHELGHVNLSLRLGDPQSTMIFLCFWVKERDLAFWWIFLAKIIEIPY